MAGHGSGPGAECVPTSRGGAACGPGRRRSAAARGADFRRDRTESIRVGVTGFEPLTTRQHADTAMRATMPDSKPNAPHRAHRRALRNTPNPGRYCIACCMNTVAPLGSSRGWRSTTPSAAGEGANRTPIPAFQMRDPAGTTRGDRRDDLIRSEGIDGTVAFQTRPLPWRPRARGTELSPERGQSPAVAPTRARDGGKWGNSPLFPAWSRPRARGTGARPHWEFPNEPVAPTRARDGACRRSEGSRLKRDPLRPLGECRCPIWAPVTRSNLTAGIDPLTLIVNLTISLEVVTYSPDGVLARRRASSRAGSPASPARPRAKEEGPRPERETGTTRTTTLPDKPPRIDENEPPFLYNARPPSISGRCGPAPDKARPKGGDFQVLNAPSPSWWHRVGRNAIAPLTVWAGRSRGRVPTP